ncbi:MAG: membrane dipeptidase, partial [Terriglobales bacterium]
NSGNMNLDTIHKGNLGAEFFSIWVEPSIYKGQFARRTLELIDGVKQQVARHPDQIVFADSPEGIEAAHRQHKFAALMGIEGGHSIENSLGLLRQYYALGVRYMTLTWSNSTDWADSSGDIDDPKIPHTKEGLSEFGKDVVYEMNKLGMMVDISHVSDKTFYDAIEISKAPVIASHSSARALTDVPRNMTDDMLRAVTKNGGVVQVNFNCGFIARDPDYNAKVKAFQQAHPDLVKQQDELEKQLEQDHTPETKAKLDQVNEQLKAGNPRPPLSDLIDHIDHLAKVAGIDHVGLGSDFDGIPCTPQGIDSVADLPKITEALVDRGYNEQQIHKILGGNLLRVFRDVERVSREMNSK